MMFIQMIETHSNLLQHALGPKPEYTANPASLTPIVCADGRTDGRQSLPII